MTAAIPFVSDAPTLQPRPYQQEALDALDEHVCTKETNPCVVIPTGGGKSILIAWIIQRWKADYSALRVCILAHRKELVAQNSAELRECWPQGDIGVYSAGLRQRDTEHSILYASIDSVFRKGGELEPFDVIIIDEAHRIPQKGRGKYLEFLKMATMNNKNIRIVGFTATPYRMNCGPICHEDHILHEICYEANVGDLIRDGYLCKLRSRVADAQPDLSHVKRNSGGDYIVKSLAEAVDKSDVVSGAVNEAMKIIFTENRQHVMFFCVDIDHCKKVAMELRRYGIAAPFITGKTPQRERDRIAEDFKSGRIRALCNVNVYTEGFNAKCIDCICLLRPTLSKGLYVQMVGRGFRLHANKTDCLVLDFAGCIHEHGPIDRIEAGEVRIATCQKCGDAFSRAIKVCPNCGWEIPKEEIERVEAEERVKRLHEAEASGRSILSGEPETLDVDGVTVHRHLKPDKPDSLRVEYRCGLATFREWVCLDHDGPAGRMADNWWHKRFGAPIPSVATAMENLFLCNIINEQTKAITVIQRGKYPKIINHHLGVSDA